ncbi:metallophosphoesterase [Massilia sp. TS11]|uniref:metallophosphoesterase family protein n=1 Tax=Massilia sp. TS11 TaxID=2908003 RepID=UPI001EDC5282|nr:metallophosphoesterase family protein [Massilia sp. TS11]MCG2585038.1 metallophosphatase family protein [Massilia sp. TS11]
MRLALLTDVHANREALEACLQHAALHGAEQFAFTGDLVGYGGDPCAVVDIVMDYARDGAIVVQGNHDEAAASDAPPRMHAEAREVILWTRTQLSPRQRAFLAELPLTARHDRQLFVHASAEQPGQWEYVKGMDEAERSLKAAAGSRLVCSGHVHGPSLFRRADDGRMGVHTPGADTTVALAPQHQYLVIPGSCGQPRDGNPAACYALYDDQQRSLSFYRVPYDNGAAARRVIAVGLPIVFAMRLIEGI